VKIAFIIVTTSLHEKHSERLRRQIQEAAIPNCTIFVVKNQLRRDGYAYGVNRGLRAAILEKCDYLFVVNPDVDLSTFLTSPFLAAGRTFDVYGYAMKQDGTTYYGGTIDEWRLSGGLNTTPPKERFTACDFVSGSLIGFRRKTLKKVGFWDERYHMYYEDVDFCKRATSAGLRVGIDRDIVYEHLEASSQVKKSDSGYDKDTQMQSSHLRFFLQNAGPPQLIYEALRYPLTRRTEPEFARLLRVFVANYFKRVCKLA
jgi:GT2 family glycosyltransferase